MTNNESGSCGIGCHKKINLMKINNKKELVPMVHGVRISEI